MRNLKLRRLSILSVREGKARQETFSKTTTVVMGENDTGKSHLMKSIYSSLGADPAVVNEKWTKAGVALFVEISVDDIDFSMLRLNDQFGFFNSSDDLVWSGSSIVKEVGPQIAQLLNFSIQLAAKYEDLITPPPQFCFMPFYQDQDRGWSDMWSSFKNLNMIRDYKKNILEYHTGIRPREFYLAQAAKAEAVREQNKLKSERQALDRTSDRLRKDRTPIRITFNPDLFANQLDQLLKELNGIRGSYDDTKKKISELQSKRVLTIEEIEIAKTALSELDADLRFVKDITETQIICPTCNTIHDNNFANRFGLINDADTCRDLLAKSQNTLRSIEKDIESSFSLLRAHNERIANVEKLLNDVQDEIKLRDMLKDESERMLDSALSDERSIIDAGISEWKLREDAALIDMKDYSRPRRKSQIIRFYADKLRVFSEELGIQFSDSVMKSISPKINETGSYGLRAILAYHYALLHTIREFTTSCLCPIVIDTPLQQDQDERNAQAIIKFALKNRPDDMQLILGTVSLHGEKYNGHLINPKQKEALLNRESYDSVRSLINPFINKMLGGEQGELL
ncbi:hypothetical protein ABZT49_02050 [Methylobacterium sp. EM32]|uniref:hypothetical protein n=1 Tax=Methylobacterium sp. EM32 TaxID=3163481 RepID=UPI0033A4BAF6